MSRLPAGGWSRRRVLGPAAALWCLVLFLASLDGLDRAYPPPLDRLEPRSVMVVDREDRLLRAFATPSGRWRLTVDLAAVDRDFLAMLIAYEDGRFRHHPGVDPLALGRAGLQLLRNGRIVSGGSTLTMQLARLIEGREERSFAAKTRQMVRALQIERRLSKDEILTAYLTLAPYGGNLEGVTSAAQAWFGKSARKLTPAEAALLVALPQLPEARRPDRFPEEAAAARNRVLDRMVAEGVLAPGDAERAKRERIPAQRLAMPVLAAHLAEALKRKAPGSTLHKTRLDSQLQETMERLVREHAKALGEKVSAALVVADHRSGDILARVGSADFFDARRLGEIDMTVAPRSPGSTLKPFVYGLAFEEGLAHPETLIEDRPADFSGYRPKNFDLAYQGTVSVRQALQLSLNVPAVKLLDGVGPQRLVARLNAAGAHLRVPASDPVGLAIGLGGTGITLEELVNAYAALARGGVAVALSDVAGKAGEGLGERVLSPVAAWYVNDILKGAPAPRGQRRIGIAFKTGTSYGHRDVWSIGYDGRHVIGVWIGRADGTPVPELVGIETAAPLLFDAFNRLGSPRVALPEAPADALRVSQAGLPVVLKRYRLARFGLESPRIATPPPAIVHPPDGARVELADGEGFRPLVLKVEGGKAPFRWVANGHLLDGFERRRSTVWLPDGAGFSTLTVIDALGRTARVSVFVE